MRWFVLLLWLIMLPACGAATPTIPPTINPVAAQQPFVIYIFDTNVTYNLGETSESAWDMLQAVPLESSIYTITDALITDYHWDTQTFTITNEWATHGEQAPCFMWGGDAAFLVTFNGQRLFGGRVVSQSSPRRFEYPAMALSFQSELNSPIGSFGGPLTYSFHEHSLVRYKPESTFLTHDPATAEAVKQHFAALGTLR